MLGWFIEPGDPAGYSGTISATSSSPFYSGMSRSSCCLMFCCGNYEGLRQGAWFRMLWGTCLWVSDVPLASSQATCSVCEHTRQRQIQRARSRGILRSEVTLMSGTCNAVACPAGSSGTDAAWLHCIAPSASQKAILFQIDQMPSDAKLRFLLGAHATRATKAQCLLRQARQGIQGLSAATVPCVQNLQTF